MVSRRTVNTGLLATGVTSVVAPQALAAGNEKQAFYRHVTREAFTKTFGNDLNAVQSDAQLKQLIESRADAYRQNFLDSASAYAAQLPEGRAKTLHSQLSHRAMKRGGGLHSVLGSDLRRYSHNGRTINPNETNPLFANIKKLLDEGKISPDGYRGALTAARNLTHKPGDVWRNFNNQLIEAVKPGTLKADLDQGVTKTASAEKLADPSKRIWTGLGDGPTGLG